MQLPVESLISEDEAQGCRGWDMLMVSAQSIHGQMKKERWKTEWEGGAILKPHPRSIATLSGRAAEARAVGACALLEGQKPKAAEKPPGGCLLLRGA